MEVNILEKEQKKKKKSYRKILHFRNSYGSSHHGKQYVIL